MKKSLDTKLEDIRQNPHTSKAFIIADAKDADMAFGVTATGYDNPSINQSKPRTIEEYRQQIREIVKQGYVDIMLCSASTIEQLAIREKLFQDTAITPAARANDTSDIWVVRGASYTTTPAKPFRSASIDHIMYGKLNENNSSLQVCGADLGLYSVTFTNHTERDHDTLTQFKNFREEAERKKFRYFLEVFDPNVDIGIPVEKIPAFINDHIIRTLAGVTSSGRPQFLKMVYHGARAMEELVSYDSQLIVGVLGGSSGTTYDAFKLISEAQKYGARVALFGRKINLSEHPLTFVEMLYRITNDDLSPEEAVKMYHATLQKLKIKPLRSLEDDSKLTTNVMSYGS